MAAAQRKDTMARGDEQRGVPFLLSDIIGCTVVYPDFQHRRAALDALQALRDDVARIKPYSDVGAAGPRDDAQRRQESPRIVQERLPYR